MFIFIYCNHFHLDKEEAEDGENEGDGSKGK